MANLNGKIAVVAGAASGIGAATARALAAAGAQVVVADINEPGAEAVARSLREAGAGAAAVAADTADEAQIANMIDVAVREFGGLDVLHNNAAVMGAEHMMLDGALHEMDAAVWDRTMTVNLRGCMLGVKYAVPHMLARGGGVIINTASAMGMVGTAMQPAYGTSKAAVIGFTRNVATQYGKQGIRCVGIAPGLIMTPTLEHSLPPAFFEMMARHHLTPTLGRPEDIANTVLFLVSEEARFITGVTIPVDGGFTAHSPTYADGYEANAVTAAG